MGEKSRKECNSFENLNRDVTEIASQLDQRNRVGRYDVTIAITSRHKEIHLWETGVALERSSVPSSVQYVNKNRGPFCI